MTPKIKQQSRATPSILFMAVAVFLFLIFLANVCLGSVTLSLSDVLGVFTGQGDVDPIIRQIILNFRLPRAMTALLGGAALAVSGLLMQTIFRNPLADPFVLGVNSGASLGVAIVMLALAPAGIALTQNWGLSGNLLIVVAASLGSASILALVLILANRMDVMSLLILGLMLSYAVGAVVSILMFFSMAEQLQSFFTWSFGQFGNVTWGQMQVFAPCILTVIVAVFFLSKPLDALLLGERYAHSLGTNVKSTRIVTLLLASILTGAVTGFCGPIGFLGIAAPHICRFLFQTSDHRILIPSTLMAGAAIALTADLIAKAPGFDTVLPLNAITALMGAPIIIAALLKQRNLKNLFGR